MNEATLANKAYPLLTMLVGMVTFLSSAVLIGSISGELIVLTLAAPLGSLLMLLILRKLDRSRLFAVVLRSIVGSFAGFSVGFLIGYALSSVLALIFPSLRDMTDIQSQILPNLVVLMVADAIFGALLADLLYGRRSVGFFALICALVSIPFGLLLSMPVDIAWVRFDQNLVFIVTSFGATTGLAMGLYRLLKLQKLQFRASGI